MDLIEKFEFVKETNKRRYYVSNYGYVLSVTKKTYKERKLQPFIKKHHKSLMLLVKIDGKELSVKSLVANAFVPGYQSDKNDIFYLDKNISNCRVDNLYVVPKSQVRKITGPMARSQGVIITDKNGVQTKYSSIRKAATNLNCSYQTLLDYMNGRYKTSVLEGLDVRKI